MSEPEDPVVEQPATQSQTPRVARLTHTQWANSVRDLLLLDEAPDLRETLPTDSRRAASAFDNAQESLYVDQALSSAYARAAVELAEQATSSEHLARLLPVSSDSDEERLEQFIRDFGLRAYRRPLTQEEVDTHLALVSALPKAYGNEGGLDSQVRLVIEAILQSPNFLYRVQTSSDVDSNRIALSSWEIAQRLSYLLVDTTPDTELLAAAREDRLQTPQQIHDQAERLLSKPAARAAISGFHEQWLNFDKYDRISPSRTLYPEVPSDLGEQAKRAARRIVEHLVFEQPSGFAELMTTSQAFVTQDLADIYGIEGSFDERLRLAELPVGERRGLLNQVGFLAANATSLNPDPIHRGVFVAKHMLCRNIAAPPDGVPPIPPSDGLTNRQIVEQHTEEVNPCRGCHLELINPFGFPFEHFGAAGEFRTMDGSVPVDTQASPVIDGQRAHVEGSLQLAETLAASREAHRCYAAHWTEFALEHEPRTTDERNLVAALTDASQSGASVLEIIVAIATSPAFRFLAPQEGQP